MYFILEVTVIVIHQLTQFLERKKLGTLIL